MQSLVLGNPLVVLFGGGPLLCLAVVVAVAVICACMSCCSRCQLRDCAVIKHFLLCIGHDAFDEFELMVLIHEAMFDHDKHETLTTIVQVTSGAHTVARSPSKGSVFQQPLHITVEQGANHLVVRLLKAGNLKILATMKIFVDEIMRGASLQPEMVYQMRQVGKTCLNPKIKLSMVASSADDVEQGLVRQSSMSDVSILVRQQLKKAQMKAGQEGASQMDVLKEACGGPLELFEGYGKIRKVYVAVIGVSTSAKWFLGIWRGQRDFADKTPTLQEVSLLKIQSIQEDPKRSHVFVINFFNQRSHVRETLTFRSIDRSRDVWVEILHVLVLKAREQDKKQKEMRTMLSVPSA